MTLEWQPQHVDEVGHRTTCNRYMVVPDGDGRWQAWKIAPGGPWFRPLLSNLATEAEARKAAQVDSDTCLVHV